MPLLTQKSPPYLSPLSSHPQVTCRGPSLVGSQGPAPPLVPPSEPVVTILWEGEQSGDTLSSAPLQGR